MRYPAHPNEFSAHCEHHSRRRLLWGVALVVLGSVFLLDRLAWLDFTPYLGSPTHWWHLLPLLLAMGGAISVVSARSVRHVLKGLVKIALGIWIFACLELLWGLSFHNSWPVLLIAFGALMLIRGWYGSSRNNRTGVPS